ncbi:MAG: ABC transporter permease [Pseudomonadales bacterium]|nr:ABC transporter permease [Pseudomonadales bacterium]
MFFRLPFKYLDFIWYRSLAQLRSESSRAYLGYLWWVLEPALYLLVFYLVFALVLNRGDENYVRVLLIGLVVFKWFDSAVRSSMDVIQQNAGLIDKVYLPKIVFPTVNVVSNGVKFAVVFLLLWLANTALAGTDVISLLFLPVLVAIHFLLVMAGACLVAAITPFVPDLRMVFDKLMTLLFFLSGVFFTADSIPEPFRAVFLINPLFALIESYRTLLVLQELPDLLPLAYVLVLALVLLMTASYLLNRFDRVYPRLIY